MRCANWLEMNSDDFRKAVKQASYKFRWIGCSIKTISRQEAALECGPAATAFKSRRKWSPKFLDHEGQGGSFVAAVQRPFAALEEV